MLDRTKNTLKATICHRPALKWMRIEITVIKTQERKSGNDTTLKFPHQFDVTSWILTVCTRAQSYCIWLPNGARVVRLFSIRCFTAIGQAHSRGTPKVSREAHPTFCARHRPSFSSRWYQRYYQRRSAVSSLTFAHHLLTPTQLSCYWILCLDKSPNVLLCCARTWVSSITGCIAPYCTNDSQSGKAFYCIPVSMVSHPAPTAMAFMDGPRRDAALTNAKICVVS